MATLKEEYEKRKQEHKKDPQRRRISFRDVLTVVLSILAFLTSLGTAYLTIIRQSDELVMMVAHAPFARRYSQDEKQLWLQDGETDLTFLNRGTRPAAIQDIRFVIIERTTEEAKTRDTCGPRGQATNLATDFHPVAVKERDVLTQRIKWVPGLDTERAPSGGLIFPISEQNITAGSFELTICLVVDFVLTSPGLERHSMYVGIGRSVIYKNQRPWHEIRGDMYELVKRTGTIFDREPKQ